MTRNVTVTRVIEVDVSMAALVRQVFFSFLFLVEAVWARACIFAVGFICWLSCLLAAATVLWVGIPFKEWGSDA